MFKDLKNSVSSICGLLIAIAGAILGISTQVVLPAIVQTICIITVAVAGAIIGWLTGRNSDGGKKSEVQLTKTPKISKGQVDED